MKNGGGFASFREGRKHTLLKAQNGNILLSF